jgi:hypothetical protein
MLFGLVFFYASAISMQFDDMIDTYKSDRLDDIKSNWSDEWKRSFGVSLAPRMLEIGIPTCFLIPENNDTTTCGFEDETLELFGFVLRDWEMNGAKRSFDKEEEVLHDLVYEETEAAKWQSPDDIPRWSYFVIGNLCKIFVTRVIGSCLIEKILDLWPLDDARNNFKAKLQRIDFIGNMLLELQ